MYNDDDYENEEQDMEDYDAEDEEQYDESYNSNTLPFSNNPIVNIKNKAGSAGRTFAKNVVKNAVKVTKAIILFIVHNPIILAAILFVVFVALIWLVFSEQISKKVTESVDKYIMSSDTIDPTAKSLYEDRHSLILLKLSEINEMYDAFIKDKSVPGDVRRAMKIKVGKNDVENKKATQPNNSSGGNDVTYGGTFTAGSDGVRSDERVKIITGSTAPISSYMTGGAYVYSNGKIGSADVSIVDITIPVWKGSGDNKVSSTATLQVNSKIKKTVEDIFKEIYEDSSKPVIDEIGCFRASDGYPNHPFGTAIDINPGSNPQIKEGDYVGGTYAPGSDPKSMDANHAIVKVFSKYGWDWGGTWSGFKDYMHFSFMGG